MAAVVLEVPEWALDERRRTGQDRFVVHPDRRAELFALVDRRLEPVQPTPSGELVLTAGLRVAAVDGPERPAAASGPEVGAERVGRRSRSEGRSGNHGPRLQLTWDGGQSLC